MAGGMIPRRHHAELMVQAQKSGNPDLVSLYLLDDPRTRSMEQAEALLAPCRAKN